MAPQVEILIPNAQTSNTPKPYTIYNITLRLPLRSYTQQKRYSDFTALHSALVFQVGAAPPTSLPTKSWFTRTTSSPELTEERRQGLEAYLTTINSIEDERWRNTSAWRAFLNLPSNNSSKSSLSQGLHSAMNGGAPITDPVVWLDHHRDLKSQLHDARLNLTRRDQAPTAQAQHESSAQAKKCLVRAGTMIGSLDTGLQNLSSPRSSSHLGEGELRRRRDLLSSAKREKEGLENLLNAMAAKATVDQAVAATVADKSSLMNVSKNKQPASGRVLGKETEKTRALDNQGVLQLQKQLMQEQDEDVDILARAMARQKELAIQIQEELEVQDSMLEMLDEDVTRVQGKMDVARNRIGKLS
ncbi:regulator of vacuolar morphogenesis, partial [Lecanoromycetidae sp. Uapishka_2]